MDSSKINLNKYTISNMMPSELLVSLKNEANDLLVNIDYDQPIALLWDYWNGLEDDNEEDAKSIPINAKDDPLVDGYEIESTLYFQKEPSKIIEVLSSSIIPSDIVPFHLIREDEIVKLYQYSSWLKIKGIETNKFMDLSTLQYDFHEAYPGYVDVSGCEKYKEILSLVPQEYQMEVTAGMDPAHDGIRKIVLIQKTQIDNIILKQQFIQPDKLENILHEGEIETYFTGEENIWELNPANPNSDVLKKMMELHILRDFNQD